MTQGLRCWRQRYGALQGTAASDSSGTPLYGRLWNHAEGGDRTATYNAASVLGIENETGSLKEGLAGDLLIVKGDVSKNIRALDDVQEVYLAGEIVYTV